MSEKSDSNEKKSHSSSIPLRRKIPEFLYFSFFNREQLYAEAILKMALLDNMYAPYSHLMRFNQSEACNSSTTDPSITRLDINVSSSDNSSPPSAPKGHIPRESRAHYGGVMTMNLKLEPNNFRPFATESPGQENNINEENRRDHQKVLFHKYFSEMLVKGKKYVHSL